MWPTKKKGFRISRKDGISPLLDIGLGVHHQKRLIESAKTRTSRFPEITTHGERYEMSIIDEDLPERSKNQSTVFKALRVEEIQKVILDKF